ncbi:MAG: peroxiredoxin [Bryobacteraceae bacterium]
MAELIPGEPAPEIKLESDTGEMFELSRLRDKNVVLYFYPKADTPGCTSESCEFRDATPEFPELDAVIVGISPDKPAAQARFKQKIRLLLHVTC